MKIIDDPLLQSLILRKQLKTNTIRTYSMAFTHYYNVTHKTPSELRQEAYNEQLTIPDKFSRKINKYLIDYHLYLQNKNLSPATIKTFTHKIRAFYTEYDIDLPKPILIKNKNNVKCESDLITIDHIRKVVNNTSNIKYKAIITLAASSGLRAGDIRRLTISDFIEATKDYHHSTNINDVLSELEGHQIIPTWEFFSEKTNEHTITFNTPECSEYITIYLKSRNKPNNNDKLFLNQSQLPYSASGFSKVFTGLSSRLSMGKHENRYNFFHAHGLRDFFSTTLNNKGIPYAIYKKMMGQTLSGVDTAYIHVNRESCKREYERCLKDLSTEKVEIKKVTSDEIKTIIKENQDLRTDFEDMKKEMEDYKTFKPLIKVFMEDEEIQKRVGERLKEK